MKEKYLPYKHMVLTS